jgi:hypothetical protein
VRIAKLHGLVTIEINKQLIVSKVDPKLRSHERTSLGQPTPIWQKYIS